MRRKQMAGAAAALLAMAAALAAGIAAPTLFSRPGTENPGPASVAFSQGADLDGDGRPEHIAAGAEGLRVTSATGALLLDFPTPITGGVQTARLGGDYPVLFAPTAPGEHAAFAYDPSRGLLQAVAWPDGQMRGYGELTPDGALRQTVVAATARQRVQALALDRLQLREVRLAYEPLTQARSTPAEALAAAVEATALGLTQELYIHFVQRSVAGAFYEAWHGKVPPGAVLVAAADQVNAGAENGHAVPVTVWIAGQNGEVAGLRGRVRFTPGDGGMQIEEALLEALPLKVRSWEDAARRLTAAHPGAVKPKRSGAPFYGRFRFTALQQRFAVDAMTGRVEAE